MEKYSFLKEILGKYYVGIKEDAPKYIVIITCVLVFLWGFSLFVHWNFISEVLMMFTGVNLFFIAYIICVIILLDKGVDVGDCNLKHAKPKGYRKTVVFGVILIIGGIVAIYFSNQYRKHYAFECETFLVDSQNKIYHLEERYDCSLILESCCLKKMQGYQIPHSYSLCEDCEDWFDYIYSNSDKYVRK